METSSHIQATVIVTQGFGRHQDFSSVTECAFPCVASCPKTSNFRLPIKKFASPVLVTLIKAEGNLYVDANGWEMHIGVAKVARYLCHDTWGESIITYSVHSVIVYKTSVTSDAFSDYDR
jgi:hypothetical protein